ncbi:MAG: Gfo/Idh/MocA family oxidoreductase [Chthoniobacterales bacterium]|nr:Gfo/Idh/MocA family oxidoreductase [Chthoniobacterales bacterium]
MTFKIGIIGCGGIAAAHAQAYRDNGVSVVAVTDVNRASAEKFVKDHASEAAVYEDCHSLLTKAGVDAVSVCTPPSTHEEIVIEALGRRIPVLCEKPLAHTLAAGERMAGAARTAQTPLMIAFRHRFLPAIQKLKALIGEGCIGRPVALSNAFCGPAFFMKDRWFSKKAVAGGGCMLDTSSHTVDIFRYLFGEIVEQHGVTNRAFEGTDVEDSSILTVRGESGVLGTFFASWGAGVGRAVLDVMGDKGRMVYEYGGNIEVVDSERNTRTWPVESSGGFTEEVAHFLRAIRGEEPLTSSWQDGLRALEIIQNVYENDRVH